MTDKQKKILFYSLIAYTIGGFLFAVGLMLKVTIAVITFFAIGIFMIICGILSLYNNYKLDKIKLYLYLSMIGAFLAIVFTTVFIAQLTGI